MLLSACCLALLAAASARSLPIDDTPAGKYTSNTQQCIVSSPKLEACAHLPFGSDPSWWNVGGHLLQCCSALREFNKPGCFWCCAHMHAAPSHSHGSARNVQRAAVSSLRILPHFVQQRRDPCRLRDHSATLCMCHACRTAAGRFTRPHADCSQQPYRGGVRPRNWQPDQGA